MNYIPGFSNYLQASVPRYAKGGPARFNEDVMYLGDAAPIMDTPREAAVMPMTQAVAPYDMGGLGGYDMGQYTLPAQPIMQQPAAAPYVAPYQPLPAVQPMTQEAAAPYDLSSLAGLDLSGLGGFGGGRMGGVIQDPNIQYIGAPVSNKGNPTGKMGGNVFAVTPDQPVRLVDLNTKTIVFEGTGYDAARKATEIGQNLTDTMGRKASYDIQTADPSGAYVTVANEKKNKSTLGTIAQVAGTLAPLAMIPLTMGLSAPLAGITTAGKIALGAGLGGLGSALKGDNVLKGAAMGGLSAAGGGYLGKTLGSVGNIGLRAGTAIGTGLGSTAGGLVTGQSLKNSLLGGVASGALSYVTPDIVKGLGINQGAPINSNTSADTSTSTGADAGGFDGINVVGRSLTPSFSTTNVNLGGFKTPTQKYLRDAEADNVTNPETRTPYNTGYDDDLIKVTGSVPGAVTGGLNLDRFIADPAANRGDEIVVSGQLPGAVTGGFTGNPAVDRLLPPETAELNDDTIKVTGRKTIPGEGVTGGLDLGALTAAAPAVLPNAIVVNATTRTTPGGGLTLSPDTVSDVDKKAAEEAEKKKKLGLEEALRLAGLASGLIGGAAGGRRTGSYASGGGGLQNVFSARLPSASGIFSSKNLAPRDMSGTDFLRYGYGPEKSFFQNVPTSAGERDRLANEFRPSSLPLSAMYDPEALRQDALRQLAIGAPIEDVLDALLLNATPQEIEFYTKTPKGQQALVQLLGGSSKSGTSDPSMYVPDDMRFAEGGAFAAKRGGSSKRTEFAVNGAGTGRSDDIPAVLSDGEYVIDAETVALLGDGSNKAGAKKLDDLRVKVRKHKGQKLAKGRFSAKAKNPEAYLSGGRV